VQGVIADRGLDVTYRHQPAHRSIWAGRDDYALWNGRADELADQGAAALQGKEL
jgi:hypothetical protein